MCRHAQQAHRQSPDHASFNQELRVWLAALLSTAPAAILHAGRGATTSWCDGIYWAVLAARAMA